jgi:hypothetical protein
MYNAFMIKIARFCLNAPGSGMITSSTYQTSSDPEFNHQPPPWEEQKYLNRTLQKYKNKEHKILAVNHNTVATSIPARKLAQTAYNR